eukprot:2869442-Alexandrium_andersonii.AAC.1
MVGREAALFSTLRMTTPPFQSVDGLRDGIQVSANLLEQVEREYKRECHLRADAVAFFTSVEKTLAALR